MSVSYNLLVSEFMCLCLIIYQDLSSCVCILSGSEFMCLCSYQYQSSCVLSESEFMRASLTGSGEMKFKENLC